MNLSEKIVTGTFATAQVNEQDLNSLSDDIATLCAISDEAGCSSLTSGRRWFRFRVILLLVGKEWVFEGGSLQSRQLHQPLGLSL
jgi:hypothetical protein